MTLYALDPDEDPEGLFTIEPVERGLSYLYSAVALWRLVDDRRADILKEAIDAPNEDSEGRLLWSPDWMRRVVALLTGLEEGLRAAGILDEKLLTCLDRVPELSRRVEGMNVRPERSEVELRSALAEVVFRVEGVRLFLASAAEAGFDVTMG